MFAAVTVTIPADAGDKDKLEPKSIVCAVPTKVPLSLTIIPDPDAVTPVSPEPSPINLVAVATPVILIPPVPSIVLLNKSRFPPNCGVLSSTILLRLPLADPTDMGL